MKSSIAFGEPMVDKVVHADRIRGGERAMSPHDATSLAQIPWSPSTGRLKETLMTLTIAALLGVAFVVPSWADCAKRVDEARESIKQAEAAIRRAKPSGKEAARTPLARARKEFLYAEAECKSETHVREQADAVRAALEA